MALASPCGVETQGSLPTALFGAWSLPHMGSQRDTEILLCTCLKEFHSLNL